MNDGADFEFDRRIMGEQDTMGMFGNFNATATATSDSMFDSVDSSVVNASASKYASANGTEAGVQQITAILTNATNLNKEKTTKTPSSSSSTAAKTATPLLVKHQYQLINHKTATTTTTATTTSSSSAKAIQNKENSTKHPSATPNSISSIKKPPAHSPSNTPGAPCSSQVSSAIELMDAATTSGILMQQQHKGTSIKMTPPPTYKPPASSFANNKPTKSATTNQYLLPSSSRNIVKKTFAKMTAAFKQQSSSSSSKTTTTANHSSAASNKIANTNTNTNATNNNSKAKDDFNTLLHANLMPSAAHVDEESSTGGRRASSVPRTLREKHELKKRAGKDSVVNDILIDDVEHEHGANINNNNNNSMMPPTQTTSLGEKIQNFFNSHNSQQQHSLLKPTILSSASQNASQKTKQGIFAKSKFGSGASVGGPVKVMPPLPSSNTTNAAATSNERQHRRRSRSCNQAVKVSHNNTNNSSSRTTTTGTTSNNLPTNNVRKTRLPTSESIDSCTSSKINSSNTNTNTSLVTSSASVLPTNEKQQQQSSKLVGKAVRSPSVTKLERQRSAESRHAAPQPQIAMYHGVKFVPKVLPPTSNNKSYQQHHHYELNDGVKLEDLIRNRPFANNGATSAAASNATSKYNHNNYQNQSDFSKKLNNNNNNSHMQKGPTPSKSASFKQHPLHAMKLNNSAAAATASNHCGDKNQKQLNQQAIIKKQTSLINSFNLEATNTTATATTSLLTRKKSECKPTMLLLLSSNNTSMSNTNGLGGCPLMHTELRALKRSEYDQQQKEKERHALMLRREHEEEKQRRQMEEIQKIRMQRHTFRSQPIKHYAPVEVKPSEKPLTEPVSPRLGSAISSSNIHSMHNLSHQSYNINNNNNNATNQRTLKSATSAVSLNNVGIEAGHLEETNSRQVNTRTASHEHLNLF